MAGNIATGKNMADFPKIIMPYTLAEFPKNRKIKRNKVVNVSVLKLIESIAPFIISG